MKNKTLPKIITVVGPTSSGKSDLAVLIAKEVGGEVISADSRQVYKGMDIGTGKITKKEMRGVPHHLLDVASPKRRFSVMQYTTHAEKAIQDIQKRGKVPIVCGGTGFYIQALTEHMGIPRVPTNYALQKKLEKLPLEKLVAMLQKKDPQRAKTIDLKNPRRVIRAIQIAKALGSVPPLISNYANAKYNVLHIGIKTDNTVLKERIYTRLLKRMRQGMLAEVKRLREEGLSWKRLEELGLEYRYLAYYLQGKYSKEEMLEQLTIKIGQYAKRQKTWFKRNKDIQWVNINEDKKVLKIVRAFLA